MPLAFESKSHGRIAFGFFNIESDMLLLEHYFFFADDFCRNISALAAVGDGNYESEWDIYDIETAADIGDPDLDDQTITPRRALAELNRIRIHHLTAGDRNIRVTTRRNGLQAQILVALDVDTTSWDKATIT